MARETSEHVVSRPAWPVETDGRMPVLRQPAGPYRGTEPDCRFLAAASARPRACRGTTPARRQTPARYTNNKTSAREWLASRRRSHFFSGRTAKVGRPGLGVVGQPPTLAAAPRAATMIAPTKRREPGPVPP